MATVGPPNPWSKTNKTTTKAHKGTFIKQCFRAGSTRRYPDPFFKTLLFFLLHTVHMHVNVRKRQWKLHSKHPKALPASLHTSPPSSANLFSNQNFSNQIQASSTKLSKPRSSASNQTEARGAVPVHPYGEREWIKNERHIPCTVVEGRGRRCSVVDPVACKQTREGGQATKHRVTV